MRVVRRREQDQLDALVPVDVGIMTGRDLKEVARSDVRLDSQFVILLSGRRNKGGKQCITILAGVGLDGEHPRAVDSAPQRSVDRKSPRRSGSSIWRFLLMHPQKAAIPASFLRVLAWPHHVGDDLPTCPVCWEEISFREIDRL